MADATADQVRRYVLDGSDDDLRRLLSLPESFAEHARRALRRVGVRPGWTVIDCGCGPIGGLAILAEMVGPAGRVVGVDFSEPTIRYARSVMAALGLDDSAACAPSRAASRARAPGRVAAQTSTSGYRNRTSAITAYASVPDP